MWRSMSLANKIFLALSILLCGYTLTIGYGFCTGIRNNARLKELSTTVFPAAKLSQSALTLFEDQNKTYQDMVATGDVQLLVKAQMAAEALMKNLNSLEKMVPEARLRNTIALTRQRCQTYHAAAPRVYEQMRGASTEYDQDIMREASMLALQRNAILNDLQRYRDYFSKTLNSELTSVGASLWRQSVLSLLVFVLVVGISVAIIFFIVVRVIREPLQKTIQAFASGAMGDFSIRLDEASQDEIGRLAHFFNNFMEKLDSYNRTIHDEILEHQHTEDALRKSDELYTRLVNTIPDYIVRTGLDGMILFVNDQALEISGFTREELIGQNMLTFIAPEDHAELLKNAVLMMESRLGPRQYHLVMKDGRKILFEVNGDVLRNEDATPFGLVFVCRDITQRKLEEQEKEQLRTQLVQAQKMESVGRLAGGVAHDFNNMLSVIIGNAEMAMLRTDPTDPLQKILRDILSAGQRSADLTRQLLAFARKQTISPKVLDLNDTVSGMLKMLQRLIGEDINLIWMPGQRLWSIRIDPSQVDQMLANLTVNARDAMNKAGKIIIETANTTCDNAYCTNSPECLPGEYVMLAVSDNGSGMDKTTLANIFEPFFTTKREGLGTGLGLATVYGIVKQNGGFINVYSEPGQGTTFRIYLPRYETVVTEATEAPGQIPIQRGTETILLVEDEESVLNLSRDMLESLGYQVLAVRTTKQALTLAKEFEGTIDLLLTDIVMPDMNGKELSERIRTIKPGLKCLYMSGYTADVIARQGILDEGVHFVPKPFSLQDLAEKVREALE